MTKKLRVSIKVKDGRETRKSSFKIEKGKLPEVFSVEGLRIQISAKKEKGKADPKDKLGLEQKGGRQNAKETIFN